MADLLLIESLKELYNAIDQQHLLYLEFGETPLKNNARSKLESYIKEYLCLAPHDAKFTFHQTADVLHKSVSTKSNFNAYKAAAAWKAIGKYADNLISHPWRKEYRDIKLYCGFYKHEIEESLVEAELMFEAMGYRPTRHSSMTLPGIIDPDRITSVSKDAIIAYVECQIMKQIWEALSPDFQITWLEILEFRENHPGSPEQVIRALTYKYRQRQYQEQMFYRSQQMRSFENQLPPDSLYKYQPMGYYNQMQYIPGHYSFPVQGRYNAMVSPTQTLPPHNIYSSDIQPPCSSSYLPKLQDAYSMNGYHMHTHYSLPNNYGYNGYCFAPASYPPQSLVPTGQLIELDSSPTHNGGSSYSQKGKLSKYESNQEQLMYQDSLKLEGPSLSERAKDDGAGSWENWDYVYRNLETQGYNRSFESTSESLLKGNQQSSSQNNSSDIDIDNVIKSDVSEKMRKMNLDRFSREQSESSSSKGRSDFDPEAKLKHLKGKPKIESFKELSKSKSESKPNKTSPDKFKKEQVFENNYSSGSHKTDVDGQLPKDSIKLKKSKENMKPLVVNYEDEEEKWQCVTCTYLNSLESTVCQMCYKSKERGCELTPQPSGGQVCPKCTLVNEPGLSTCAACSESLKDSPTYI